MSHMNANDALRVHRIINILRESESPSEVVLQAANWLCGPGEHVTFTTTDRTQPKDEIIAAFMAATAWVGDTPQGEVIEAYRRIREARALVLKGKATT